MNCAKAEEWASDYLEDALAADDRRAMASHLETCSACTELLAGISDVLSAGKAFPVYEPPPWLAARIVANTPRIARETWRETVASIWNSVWKWISEPRIAMGAFTAVLVLGWLGSIAGISSDWVAVVRHPSSIYYGAHTVVNRAYDGAIRKYYRSPLVTEIQTRIEQFREIS
jgi:hypothetical protein